MLLLSEAPSLSWLWVWIGLICILLPIQGCMVAAAVHDHNKHLDASGGGHIGQPYVGLNAAKNRRGPSAEAMLAAAVSNGGFPPSAAYDSADEEGAAPASNDVNAALLLGLAEVREEVAELRAAMEHRSGSTVGLWI